MKGIKGKYIVLFMISSWVWMTCSGCLYIPYHYRGGAGRVQDETMNEFVKDKTTRSDVLLRIGPPNVRYDNDMLFIYKWHGSFGTLIFLSSAGDVYSQEALCVFFNPDNTLKSYKYLSKLEGAFRDDDDPICDRIFVPCSKDWKEELIDRCIHGERTGDWTMQ